MKQMSSVVTVIGDDKTKLGKCTLCARFILNDNTKFWCKETRMINLKLYCGGCLLELAETVHNVTVAFNVQHKAIQSTEQRYYTIDEATGRMVVDG